MQEFSSFDLIMVALIFFLGLKGLIDGFVKEFFGLAGIIGGIYYGSRYAKEVGEWISNNIFYIKNEAALSFVGFIVTLATIWVLMVILGNFVTKLTHLSGIGTINRILGAVFGWAKIFLIFSVLIYAASSIELTKKIIQKYTKNSKLYPLMMESGGYIIKLKPQDIIPQPITKEGKNIASQTKEEILNQSTKEIVNSIKGD